MATPVSSTQHEQEVFQASSLFLPCPEIAPQDLKDLENDPSVVPPNPSTHSDSANPEHLETPFCPSHHSSIANTADQDQSMPLLPSASSSPHTTPHNPDQFMLSPLPIEQGMLDILPSLQEDDDFKSFPGQSDYQFSNNLGIAPSLGPATDAAAGGEICRPASGSHGDDSIPVAKRLAADAVHDSIVRILSRDIENDRQQELSIFTRLRESSFMEIVVNRLLDPQEPPTSSKQCYFTTFQAELKGDKNAEHWEEKEVKAIRDPSAPRDILGLMRTLVYMNGKKRTKHRAHEYIVVDKMGDDAVQIRKDIAFRTVFEEGKDKETAPPSNCSKTKARNGGESHVWQYMTKVYVEAGSTEGRLLYAICNDHDCDKALKCPPNFGIANLGRHLENVHKIYPPCKNQRVITAKA